MSIQCALLDVHFLVVLEELTHAKFLRIKKLGKICVLKFSRKIRSLVKLL